MLITEKSGRGMSQLKVEIFLLTNENRLCTMSCLRYKVQKLTYNYTQLSGLSFLVRSINRESLDRYKSCTSVPNGKKQLKTYIITLVIQLLERNAEMTRRWQMSIARIATQSGGGPHQIIPHLKNLRKQKRAKGKNTPSRRVKNRYWQHWLMCTNRARRNEAAA